MEKKAVILALLLLLLGCHHPTTEEWKMVYPLNSEVRLNPEWIPVGRHVEVTWKEVNPRPGKFDFHKIKPDRQTMLIVQIAGHDTKRGTLVNYSPDWIGREYVLRPDGCRSAHVPAYDDPVWQAAFSEMVQALGEEFAGKVAGVWLGLGIDGETQPAKRIGRCDYLEELDKVLPCDKYLSFLDFAMQEYRKAFPRDRLLVQPLPSACYGKSGFLTRSIIISRAESLGIGYKANGLMPDSPIAKGYKNGKGWGMFEIGDRLKGRVPVAYEPAYSAPVGEDDALEYGYWMIHGALAHGADFIAVQRQWVEVLNREPDVWRLAWDVWHGEGEFILFRDAECEPQIWTHLGAGCDPGDWEVGIHRVSGGVREFNVGPSPYGRQARCLLPGDKMSLVRVAHNESPSSYRIWVIGRGASALVVNDTPYPIERRWSVIEVKEFPSRLTVVGGKACIHKISSP